MPRPMNWIRGEGTVKNQRWGLGDITSPITIDPNLTSSNGYFDASLGMTSAEFNQAVLTLNNPPNAYGPNQSNSFEDYGYTGALSASRTGGQTVMQWIQANSTFLLVGGVLGLLLFKKN